jgi:hypothetical protein
MPWTPCLTSELPENHGDRLPLLRLARALVRLDAIASRLAELRQRLMDAQADFRAVRDAGTPWTRDNATGRAFALGSGRRWQRMAGEAGTLCC